MTLKARGLRPSSVRALPQDLRQLCRRSVERDTREEMQWQQAVNTERVIGRQVDERRDLSVQPEILQPGGVDHSAPGSAHTGPRSQRGLVEGCDIRRRPAGAIE